MSFCFFVFFISAIAKESDAETMNSNLSDPHPKIYQDDENSTWYVFGYGSLFSSSSRIITQCNLRGKQADFIEWKLLNENINTTFKQEKANCILRQRQKIYIPTTIRGYRRGWYTRGKLPPTITDMPENSLFIRPTYLGIVKDERYDTTGLLYSVSREDLRATDQRETRGAYIFETLSKDDINLLSDENIPENAKIRIYVSAPNEIHSPSHNFPIVQSYVDVFIGGALEFEEKNPGFKNFSMNICMNTYGWSGEWVNDRIYSRHPHTLSLRAEKIDELLYRCAKQNELIVNGIQDIKRNSSSLRPLLPMDIVKIKLQGYRDNNSSSNSNNYSSGRFLILFLALMKLFK